ARCVRRRGEAARCAFHIARPGAAMTSFGFTFSKQAWTARRRKAARRLSNLQIQEVSSVDRGAGHGCEIKLIKRSNEMPSLNQAVGASRIAKLLNDRLASGELSNVEWSQYTRELAEQLHPNARSPLTEFFASPIGKSMLAECQQPQPAQMRETYS